LPEQVVQEQPQTRVQSLLELVMEAHGGGSLTQGPSGSHPQPHLPQPDSGSVEHEGEVPEQAGVPGVQPQKNAQSGDVNASQGVEVPSHGPAASHSQPNCSTHVSRVGRASHGVAVPSHPHSASVQHSAPATQVPAQQMPPVQAVAFGAGRGGDWQVNDAWQTSVVHGSPSLQFALVQQLPKTRQTPPQHTPPGQRVV
jgi:hypothetical protein